MKRAFVFLTALAACSKGIHDDRADARRATPADAASVDAASPDAAPIATPPDAHVDARPPDAGVDASGVLGVSVFGTTPTAYAGHTTSAGSSLANDICPAGQVLTGLRGRLRGTDLYHGPIWGACRPLALVAATMTLTTGSPATDMPEHGDPLAGDTTWARDCAEGQIIVGIEGRAGAIIDQMVIHCAPLVVAPQPPYTVTIGAETKLEPAGDLAGGSGFAPLACPAGQLGRGISTYFDGDPTFGLQSIYLDGVAIVCTTATVQ
jgi:hypothetical protein